MFTQPLVHKYRIVLYKTILFHDQLFQLFLCIKHILEVLSAKNIFYHPFIFFTQYSDQPFQIFLKPFPPSRRHQYCKVHPPTLDTRVRLLDIYPALTLHGD